MVGQQKLLIIAAGSLLVSIAIFAGLTLFKGSALTTNREQIISELMALGAKAKVYFMKPLALSGGGRSFRHFQLASSDTGDANGSYSCSHTAPQNAKYVAGSTKAIKSSNPRIYIIGCGKEIGNNGRDVVKAYIKVTRDSLETRILN